MAADSPGPIPLDSPVRSDLLPFRPPEHRTWLPGGLDSVTETLPDDRACARCALGRGAKTICMPTYHGPVAEAERNVPLLVMGTPTARDDVAGSLVYAGGNMLAVDEVKKNGKARITWALRCAAGKGADNGEVAACRPYLAREVDACSRAIALGPLAAFALLGFEIDARRYRRARAVVRGKPVFVVHEPAGAARNRFWREQFRQDLAWAMTAPVEAAPDGAVSVLRAPEAVLWLQGGYPDSPRAGAPLVVDVEHWPKNPWAPGEFRMLCMGLCTDERTPRVIDENTLAIPEVGAALRRVLEDPAVPKVNQNIKHDRHVIWRVMGIDVIGVEHDTMIYAQLLDSENPAGLGALSWKTGYGGVKQLGQAGSDEDDE